MKRLMLMQAVVAMSCPHVISHAHDVDTFKIQGTPVPKSKRGKFKKRSRNRKGK